jgi:PAS domain S-box-containing protein
VITAPPIPAAALRGVCETASLALGCAVRAILGTESLVVHPDGSTDEEAPDALTIPIHGTEGGELRMWRRAAWTAADRAMAARFGELAATAVRAAAAEAGHGCVRRQEVEDELRAANERLEQRVAERTAALRESEEHFRTLIENAHDIVAVLDGESGRLTYQSPSMQRVLGYPPEELAAVPALSLVHPDDLEHVSAAVQAAFASPGTPQRAEYRYRHREGGWRHLETFGRVPNSGHARPVLVFNTRDVTEQREAEAALHRSEAQFRIMIENGSDLLMISAPDGPLTYVSPSARWLLGMDPSEMLGRTPSDLLHPDDVEYVIGVVRDIVSQPGVLHRCTWRIRHAEGGWRTMDALGRTLMVDSADQGVVINARDVTEQRAAEAEVVRQRAFFEQILNGIDAGLAVFDAQLRFEYASPRAVPDAEVRRWLIGRTNEEYIAHRGLPPEIGSERQAHMEQVLRTGEPTSFVQDAPLPDGTARHFMRRLVPMLDEHGAVQRIIGYSIDITERKAVEEALRQARAEAEQAREEAERANRAKSEFLSRMSHELRTPLNSILGFAQVLADLDVRPEVRGGLRHILNGGRHLLNLINEVLDIARIEANQQPMSLEPVRLGAVIREAVDMVRPLAAARGIVVGEVTASSDEFVRADRQRLAQVLLNLLSNAVKYNRPEGAVRIGCEVVRDERGAPRLRVRVADQGAGIDPAARDQLFIPFARLGAEHTGVEGTGLGLALSQRLAQAMGGALFLERTGPEGSAFCVDLEPAVNPLHEAPLGVAAPEPGGGPVPAATLLYVEDNLANLSLVEAILAPRPEWRLVPALQGRLGLELALRHAPDVVLLDLHLPDLSGREVLRQLRADPRTASIPVAIISADATPRTVDALLAQGADAFLTKPLDVRAFLATVERLLPAPEPA